MRITGAWDGLWTSGGQRENSALGKWISVGLARRVWVGWVKDKRSWTKKIPDVFPVGSSRKTRENGGGENSDRDSSNSATWRSSNKESTTQQCMNTCLFECGHVCVCVYIYIYICVCGYWTLFIYQYSKHTLYHRYWARFIYKYGQYTNISFIGVYETVGFQDSSQYSSRSQS